MTTQVGKAMRLKRVIDPAGVSVICALDHGMTSPTFLEPLADITPRTARGRRRRSERDHDEQGHDPDRRAGVLPDDLARVAPLGVREPRRRPARDRADRRGRGGPRLGADAVVLFTALGGDTEAGMIEILSAVGRECAVAGHAVHRRGRVPDDLRDRRGAEAAVRLRVPAAQRPAVRRARRRHREDELARRSGVVRQAASRRRTASRSCSPAARVWRTTELLTRMEQAMAAGAIGCSVGRNIFMHRSPEAITRALSRVIRERWTRREGATRRCGRSW